MYLISARTNVDQQCILSVCLNYEYNNELKTCDEQIKKIVRSDDCDIILDAWMLLEEAAECLSNVTHKFENVMKILKSKRNIKYLSDEVAEYHLHCVNTINIQQSQSANPRLREISK